MKIIKANSSGLKDSQKQYSAVETELLALKFACESSYYYLFGAREIHVYTDSSGLEGMFTKTLDKHKNLRIRAMIEKLMIYNFVFTTYQGKTIRLWIVLVGLLARAKRQNIIACVTLS